jgi:hypothetical protein
MKNLSYTIVIVVFIVCFTSCTANETKITTTENTLIKKDFPINNRLIMPEKV